MKDPTRQLIQVSPALPPFVFAHPIQFHLYPIELMSQWLVNATQRYQSYLEALRSAVQASLIPPLSLCLCLCLSLSLSFSISLSLCSPAQVWTYSPSLYRHLTETLLLPAERVFLVPLWTLVDSGRFFFSKYRFVKSKKTGALQLPLTKCRSMQLSMVVPPPSETVLASCALKPMRCSKPPSPCPQTDVVFFAPTFTEPFPLDRSPSSPLPPSPLTRPAGGTPTPPNTVCTCTTTSRA
jgi:hypothetical protein